LQKRLNKSTKSAVGLDTCALTESESGQKQFIIAVAGQDSSIELLTINHISFAGFSTFKPYTILRDIHSGPLTRLAFSNFVGPPLPVSKDTRPQFVRLASVGVDQTVVVHTLRLRPHPSGKTKKPSYVLVGPGSSEVKQTAFSVLAALLVAAIAAFLMQVFCEIRGAVPPTLGSPNWLSPSLRDRYYIPYILADTSSPSPDTQQMPEALSSAISAIIDAPSHIPIPIPSFDTVQDTLSSLVIENSKLETPKAIVVRDTGSDLSAELHHDAEVIKEETLKKWEDLSEHQKRDWKERLKDAGHWAEQQGETVLKGILFSELAGIVGDAVRG
jgi:glycyl-tRNA synthetase